MNHITSANHGETSGVLILEAGRIERHYWTDLWRYRELFYFLAWRDVVIRYKQTLLGAAWAVVRPFLTMVVFTVLFGKLASLPSDGLPYPVLVFTALLPWQLFASSFAESGNSLVNNSNLISKVYFPRLVIPASTLVVSLVDFAISFAILIALMAWYGQVPGLRLFALPLFVVLAVAAAFAAGIWTAALNVKYRDVRHVIPFVVQTGLYVSPVGFSSTIVPEQWRFLYCLNPMVGVIDGFRWSLSDGRSGLYLPGLLLSIAVVCLLIRFGIRYFRRTERSFADLI